MSWSMSWEGRFAAAKKVALAMESLVRCAVPARLLRHRRFLHPRRRAQSQGLAAGDLEHGRSVYQLAGWFASGVEHARPQTEREPADHRHHRRPADGLLPAGRLYCEWPLSFGGISQRAAEETLKEVERITRKGITINTFMLDDSPVLRGFVDDLTRINKGRAFYTRPDRLGRVSARRLSVASTKKSLTRQRVTPFKCSIRSSRSKRFRTRVVRTRFMSSNGLNDLNAWNGLNQPRLCRAVDY